MAVLAVAVFSLGGAVPASASTRHVTKHASSTSPKAKIIANWEAFFSGKTPPKRKIALVQDGKDFAKVINGQASGGMAKSATAKVLSVKVVGKKAVVTYTIYLAGEAALKNQKGEALLEDGTWKVGGKSFCALLSLEGTKPKICATFTEAKK
jgi:hypothetical protein